MKKKSLFKNGPDEESQTSEFADDDIKELAEKAEELGIPYLKEIPTIEKEVLGIISQDIAKQHKVIAFEQVGRRAKIGIIDPADSDALNILRFLAEKKRLEFDLYLVSSKMFDSMVSQYEGNAENAIQEAMNLIQSEYGDEDIAVEKVEEEEKNENIQSAPVAKLLRVIIRHAIEGKASDIHIEPVEKEYRVRFRVDGVLHSSLVIPKEVGKAVVSRIKILSNLKIDEKRKPQDGRFKTVEDGHKIDFRVSSLPVVDGEKVVLRLLDPESKLINIEEMGLMGKGGEILLKNIREPYGIILMTGPTGSGKSTTLYACLDILNKEERNIITLEDPVEYSIKGVNQSQINSDIGYTFASGLRSILRQDPNVIMVGEIRDSETAELTIHASLTGHLVLSTLHTNSSIGAIPRLIDMGIEPFLISSSLRVVAAQRLVRRICDNCMHKIKVPASIGEYIRNQVEKVPKEELDKYGLEMPSEIEICEGKGCEFCGNTGYKGRVAIFEAVEIDKQIQDIISEQRGAENIIKEYAEKQGMISIKQDGMIKVLLGLTTLSEVERVTEGTRSVGGEIEDDAG